MIKIRKFSEEFYDGIKYNTYHEIFVNPTKKELDIVYNEDTDFPEYRSVRFLAKNDTKKLYIFSGDMTHNVAIKKIFNERFTIMLNPHYQMLGGTIEGDDYTVTNSDSLSKGYIELSNNLYMYLKFLLETDWSWIDKYIYFSDWWEETMVPKLKLQLITIEQEKLSD